MKIVETNKLIETARKNGFSEEDIKQISEIIDMTPDVNANIVFGVGDIVFCKDRNNYGVVVGEGSDEYYILTDDKLKRPVKISAHDWELEYTGRKLNGINHLLSNIISEDD